MFWAPGYASSVDRHENQTWWGWPSGARQRASLIMFFCKLVEQYFVDFHLDCLLVRWSFSLWKSCFFFIWCIVFILIRFSSNVVVIINMWCCPTQPVYLVTLTIWSQISQTTLVELQKKECSLRAAVVWWPASEFVSSSLRFSRENILILVLCKANVSI